MESEARDIVERILDNIISDVYAKTETETSSSKNEVKDEENVPDSASASPIPQRPKPNSDVLSPHRTTISAISIAELLIVPIGFILI